VRELHFRIILFIVNVISIELWCVLGELKHRRALVTDSALNNLEHN